MVRRPSRLAIPKKILLDRMAVVVLVVASMLLLVVGKLDLKLVDLVASRAGDAAAPVLRLVALPVEAARGAAQWIGDALAMQDENARLRVQVDRLLAWQAEATRLDVENRALRRIADMPPIVRATPVAVASVVADTGGNFMQTRLIDAGTARGVEIGQAVVDEKGLVGRIVAVGGQSARVLLITDLNAKIPVLVAGSGDRALLEGGNGRLTRLRFLPRDPRFAQGDRVVTSGDGGLIPAGIPVGVISRTDGSRIDVTPFADWDRLDFVQVLRAPPVEPPEATQSPGLAKVDVAVPTRLAGGALP